MVFQGALFLIKMLSFLAAFGRFSWDKLGTKILFSTTCDS